MRYRERHFRFGDTGPDVTALQKALIVRGHPLPKGGADGVLGAETWRALEAHGQEHGHWNPRIPLWVSLELLEGVAPPALARPKTVVTVESARAPLVLTSPKAAEK